MPSRSLLFIFFFIVLVSSENTNGQWKLLRDSIGISAMHMALLPNNRILIFDRTDFGRSNISLPSGQCRNDTSDTAVEFDCTAHSVEFNPATRGVRPLKILTDTWCSSGSLTPNGTLLQTGGFNDGDHAVRFFSPCTDCDWTEDKHGLAVRRWYATNHILPDGRVIILGGRDQFNYEFLPKLTGSDYSIYNLEFLAKTKDSDKIENNLYPFVHLTPDGNLFVFANNNSILLNYVTHKVVRTFPVIPSGCAHNYPSTGSSVLLPLRLDFKDDNVKAEVMICGGTVRDATLMAVNGTFLPASKACGRLTITDVSPEWEMEEMPMGRTMGDMVLLPTGDVLIINGAMKGAAGWYNGREPALHPVIYSNHTFTVLNPSVIPRLYHSTAILMPDGRVVVGGSNPNRRYDFSGVLYPTELSLEAFSPPYLWPAAPRPDIVSLPEKDIGYGEKLLIEFTARKKVDGLMVTMVAPSFNSHSFSMNQRLLVLEVGGVREVSARRYVVEVVAPAGATLAPPGYYLVFVVQDGVPSQGKWVRIKQ